MPKRQPFQFAGANGTSSNTTAPSQESPWAGPPKRCSALTVKAKLVGWDAVVASTATRICGGANSSILTDTTPRMRPFLPGMSATISQSPLGWSSGTVNPSCETVPSLSVVFVTVA